MNNINDLKDQIKKQLDLCESSETPTVCTMKQTPEGYNEIETLILKRVMYGDNTSISDAIVDIENEFNINAIDN